MTREKVIENLKANDMCKAYLVAEEAYKLLEKDAILLRLAKSTIATLAYEYNIETLKHKIELALTTLTKAMEEVGC